MPEDIEDYYMKVSFPKVTTSQQYRRERENIQPIAPKEQAGSNIQQEQQQVQPQQQYYSGTFDLTILRDILSRLDKIEKFEINVKSALQEIKENIAKLEALRTELEEMRKGYADVERTLYELAALYDLVSSQVNPFVDATEERKSIEMHIAKKDDSVKKNEPLEDWADYTSDNISKWGRFLLDRVPKEKIPDLLEHYINIGWLDNNIKNKVISYIESTDYVSGIKVRKDDDTEEGMWWKLSINDHVKSLHYIEKIREERMKTRIKTRGKK